ncbi:PH domain-containing protein [Bhargavaea cecembensis]|uniref:PH domain-containing protein n=1 Tax=Bhargavaea cecembensis TaxID=394098 RepID=UPI00058BA79B|nr:PH domain-containing protein [Bhargavaea cecembensis]
MRREPANRISGKGLTVWRIHGVFYTLMVLVPAIAASVLAYIFDGPVWIYIVSAAVPVLMGYLLIGLFPKIRWQRWRYEVRETEIELQHGLFIVKRTLVPMVRVQHVDTSQGPILRKYGLAGITVSTAATTHEIPALQMEEADDLRNRISGLARVAEDDV